MEDKLGKTAFRKSEGIPISFLLNGEVVEVGVQPSATLLEVLRNELGILSVRGTCGIGVCGTCTVILNERVVSSCILLAVLADGSEVITAESEGDNVLTRVKNAFVEACAFQCSYCIPAMVLSVRACLTQHPHATAEDVREFLGGNLCRCGTYPQILAAVHDLLDTA